MRNDARPLGEASPASPVGGDATPIPTGHSDSHDPNGDDHQSHIVHEDAENGEPQSPGESVSPQRRSSSTPGTSNAG